MRRESGISGCTCHPPGITGPNWFSGLDKLVLGQLFNPRAGSGHDRKAAGSGSTLDSDWFTGVSVCAL